jgi:dienelactone hydrolase
MAAAQTARIEIHAIQTMTLTDEEFLAGNKNGKPAIIGGELQLPPGNGRFPAVVLVHGSSGAGAREDYWSQELNGIGVAAFVLDSFTGRGIVEMQTDQSQMGSLSMIGDAYRVLAILSKHPRIDPSRIALMGFSKGGYVALNASLKRFQRMYAPPSVEFSAYIPFYATCFTSYIDEDQVSDRPIRMFHGTADDYVPADSCRQYVKRLQGLGKDIQRTEYTGARHAFDNPLLPPVRQLPDAQIRSRRCLLEERPGGQIVNSETKQPFTFSDPCIERGATVGHDPKATAAATKAVKEFPDLAVEAPGPMKKADLC